MIDYDPMKGRRKSEAPRVTARARRTAIRRPFIEEEDRRRDYDETRFTRGFVAHKDIHPTLEWQVEIERALHCMNAFVSIHTPGFSSSFWTQQEISFAVAKGVKIIALGMGEDPTGFLANKQPLPRRNETADEVWMRR